MRKFIIYLLILNLNFLFAESFEFLLLKPSPEIEALGGYLEDGGLSFFNNPAKIEGRNLSLFYNLHFVDIKPVSYTHLTLPTKA